jgi:endonuclease/exonuclease/phosphatase family metal-dependent hydrolase
MPTLSVASFNTHAGIDGWGRPYDLRAACETVDADVLVLQEVFAPLEGTSQADQLAESLGYSAVELPLARSWRRREPIGDGKGWQPRRLPGATIRSLQVGTRLDRARKDFEEGTWGLAILTRVPYLKSEAYEFGKLKRDFTHRGALMVELDLPAGAGHNFPVIGTHAAHVSAGSPVHFRHLRHRLPPGDRPAAALGDMNIWGPPLTLLLPGWTRAVKGRTWPAWRPHSQPDHILVTESVTVNMGEVLRVGNSDHLAVRAELEW